MCRPTPYKSVVPAKLQDLRPLPSFTKSSMASFAAPAIDNLFSNAMSAETMISDCISKHNLPFLASTSSFGLTRCDGETFIGREGRFQYRYDRLFSLVFSRTSPCFPFSFSVEKVLGIKSAKSYQNPRKGDPTIRNLKGRAWQHCNLYSQSVPLTDCFTLR